MHTLKRIDLTGMHEMREYIVFSLETHLFFARIMKEHALFLEAAFPAIEENYIKKAAWYREQFEHVLEFVTGFADGKVREEVLCSGEVVTEFTDLAEQQTERLTGISINQNITEVEKRLRAVCWENMSRDTLLQVRNLNQNVMQMLNGLILLKESIIKDVSCCRLYTFNYPLLIEHILREAKWYRQTLINLENRRSGNRNNCRVNSCGELNTGFMNEEMFWNQIMMEHAQFIRGLLDPTECELMETSDDFAKKYCRLLETAREQDCRVNKELSKLSEITQNTLETTESYRDFKTAAVQGLTECKIRSVILPLLADHVLREANHFLRLLKE